MSIPESDLIRWTLPYATTPPVCSLTSLTAPSGLGAPGGRGTGAALGGSLQRPHDHGERLRPVDQRPRQARLRPTELPLGQHAGDDQVR